MITLQFVGARGLASSIIERFGAGSFSHVDAELPDGTLLGARSDSIGGRPPGVQIRPADYGLAGWRIKVKCHILASDIQEADFYDFLKAQEGKPYDKLAIFAFVIGRDWRDDSAWFCDELDAAGLERAKVIPDLYLPASKMSPTSLALALSATGKATFTKNLIGAGPEIPSTPSQPPPGQSIIPPGEHQ